MVPGLRQLTSFGPIACVLVFAIGSASGALAREAGSLPETRDVQLGDRVLRIPKSYLKESDRLPDWLRWLPGLDDDSKSMLMTLGADEVAAHVPGYVSDNRTGKEDLDLYVAAYNPIEIARFRNPDWARDIWQRSNLYATRFVEREPDTGLYRIYMSHDLMEVWDLLTIDPDTRPLPRETRHFLLGYCQYFSKSVTGDPLACTGSLLVNRIYVQFSTNGANFKHIEGIRNYLAQLFRGWIVK